MRGDVYLRLECLERPADLFCEVCRCIDGRMTPFRRMRARALDLAEVKPDTKRVTARSQCIGILIDGTHLLFRQSFRIEAHLCHVCRQMREVLRFPEFGDHVTDIGVTDKDRLIRPLAKFA